MGDRTFNEQYVVTINRLGDDGYWIWGEELNVYVEVVHGVNEKDNHKQARAQVRKQYPDCEIVKVNYA